jgi:DNA helicase II / ATP-dependent DNA helicase PcrA
MRMPNSRELSDEQEEIYLDAPTDGSILVAGPPGTGKTVIAFLRARTLSAKKKNVQVLMYNNVLQKYTDNITDAEGNHVASSTLHRWLPGWWESHKIESEPKMGDKIYLDCPFERKDEVKALGAKWDSKHFVSGKRRPGQWYVRDSVYQQNVEAFTPFIGKEITIPKIDEYVYDWSEMVQLSAIRMADGDSFRDWSHIIIDEAQDFPPQLYAFLKLVSTNMTEGGLTILADENQRLSDDENSTLPEIRDALKVPPERDFLLTENFRNTREIAQLAAHFYVGLETGISTLPKKRGDKPRIIKTNGLAQQLTYIVNLLKDKGFGEVGVIVHSESMRNKIYNKLTHQLRGQYRVQTYSNKMKKEHPVEDLVFDSKGTVTVLNRQSCKGLEFDAVFIPELQTYSVDGSNETGFKMNMYVMCSRARLDLTLLYTSGAGEPSFLEYLPPSNEELEYING